MRASIVATLLALILAAPPSAPAQTGGSANPPLSVFSYPMSGWMDTWGPVSQGYDWTVRKALGDLVDLATWTPNIANHPLLDPELGPFITLLHEARVWRGITRLASNSVPANAVRLVKFYSSGWAIQAKDASGATFAIMVDFSDGPFAPGPGAPGLVPLTPPQLDALANQLDAYFISHSHIDHISPYLMYRMLLDGKLVVAPLEVKIQALLGGYPNAQNIVSPSTSAPIQFGPVTFRVFSGWQYGSFLDPARTIPDPNDPFNVQNNAYAFQVNGATIAHFGDNNDPGILTFADDLMQSGWTPDICLNLGSYYTALGTLFQPQLRFHSHDLEFHHFGNNFLLEQISQAGPNNLRRVLFWGDFMDVVP